MANKIVEQKIVDNNKRSLIKYVFLSDGTAEANTKMIDVSNLKFALNANGYIMQSNTHPKSTYRTTIKRVFGTAKSSGYVKLQWEGVANSEILTFSGSSFDYDFSSMGDGAVISNPEANATGDIIFSTVAAAANDCFTLFVDLRKNSEDYDSGQTADPYAFNRIS
jgi:hypothetical protein